jgi:NOL1/NOP2/fmu family ribosome biogenesis protein
LRTLSRIPWTKYGYYLYERPSFTFDPLFHAGCYYVQEASSMFLEVALKQSLDLEQSLRVLDLCAAPGGKSTHIQSLLSKDSLLVSNETIRGRVPVLQDNVIKWGCENVVVTNNDATDFSSAEDFFDAIVIDAPCSGSGLFRRDPEAITEWSEQNVQLCCGRQQRIIADVWPALKKDGIIIYSTCSYSKEEDENIIEWILETMDAEYLPLSIENNWNIADTGKGYRFWPDKLKGEGFFLAVLRKKDGAVRSMVRKKNIQGLLSNLETERLGSWMNTSAKIFLRVRESIYAIPEQLADEIFYLLKELKVLYAGIRIGEFIREKFLPDHALAMSVIISPGIVKNELNFENAIRYLQRKDIQLDGASTGWQLVTCKDHLLGWVNILPNRVNNYYPKELRILKDKPGY